MRELKDLLAQKKNGTVRNSGDTLLNSRKPRRARRRVVSSECSLGKTGTGTIFQEVEQFMRELKDLLAQKAK